MSLSRRFTTIASAVAHATGKPLTFMICLAIVILWGVSGPIFSFSDTWQLIINTGTTIVTFLMVFLIQNTQNRDSAAIHAKLDELVRTSAAQNAFIGIEHLTEEELDEIRTRCETRAKGAMTMKKVAQAAQDAEARAHRKARDAADRAVS